MSESGIERIAVIGGGLMGKGIAQVFAAAGRAVKLQDVSEEALAATPGVIRDNLILLAENDLFPSGEIDDAVSRVSTTTDLDEAADGAQFIVEAVFEELALKQRVFARLDELCPEKTILATNTSVMSVGEIGASTLHRERVIGTHFWNPPFLLPLVEVVRTPYTAQEVIDTTIGLLREVGKRPIDVKKDVPGFVANRLHHALWREAISIVEQGIADPETVDESIRYGFGLRLPVLGPLENADMVGLDLTLSIHDYILPHIEDSPQPSPLLRRQKVADGDLGFKTGEGFRTWTPEEAEASRRRLAEYLVHVLADERRRELTDRDGDGHGDRP